MKRLTFVDEDGQILFDNPAGFPEDVGFTIRELAKDEEWEALDNIAQRLANCEQRLKYYKDLEEQGKLLKLPCAVGDTAWIVFKGEIFKCMVSKFDIVRNGIFPMLRINETLGTISVSMKTLEKTWFLTKEAAEAALEEMSE